MLRFYANENIPAVLIQAMRSTGLDTRWASEDAPSETDAVVLQTAMREARVLITFDMDFGQLAFQAGLPSSCGVILLRFPQQSPELVTNLVMSAIATRRDWQGHFSVIEPGKIRMTPLPKSR